MNRWMVSNISSGWPICRRSKTKCWATTAMVPLEFLSARRSRTAICCAASVMLFHPRYFAFKVVESSLFLAACKKIYIYMYNIPLYIFYIIHIHIGDLAVSIFRQCHILDYVAQWNIHEAPLSPIKSPLTNRCGAASERREENEEPHCWDQQRTPGHDGHHWLLGSISCCRISTTGAWCWMWQ